MDVVVYLALGVLTAVFLTALLILIFMCYRRRVETRKFKASPLRFSKLSEIENIENLGQLSPLIGELLDKNVWVYDVSGLLQHSVAILRLCRTLTEKLSALPLSQATPQISEAICMATQRVMPRFDDLLCAIASPSVDIRVLEARATALATVCWALVVPFSIINIKFKEMLSNPLTEMNQHLTSLRIAAELAERTEHSKVDIDWDRMVHGGDEEDDEDDDGDDAPSDDTEATMLTHTTETTPLVCDVSGEEEDLKPSTSTLNIEPNADSPEAEEYPLITKIVSNGGTPIRTTTTVTPNGTPNGTAHPVDPKA